MRASILRLAFLLPLTVRAANIVLGNDDGWAEVNIRTFYDALTEADESVVLAAPAENESGTGSSEAPPTPVTSGCEFSSCPPGSPAIGFNTSQPRLNYINSYPVTAIKYGVQNLSLTYFSNKAPDLVVAGPNVGSNLGLVTLFSGTVGVASAAASQLHVPGIAFSGATGKQTAWDVVPVPDYSTLYVALATKVTTALIEGGPAPYLPGNVYVNVNFPAAGKGTGCQSRDDFKFVLSRIFTATLVSGEDVVTCGNGGRLPTETEVVGMKGGCYVSVSVGKADTKVDASAVQQGIVLERLGSILTCLP